GLLPDLAQQRRVEVGAVGDDQAGPEAPVLEHQQEAPQVRLVVDADQGEADDLVGYRVGSQQQGEAAQVQLVDAQHDAEPLQAQAAVVGDLDPATLPVQAVVDEARREAQQEVALDGAHGALDVEAVLQQAVEDGLADGGVVVGLRGDVQRPGAEVLAAT